MGKSSLATKLAEVMGEIGWIPKMGTNTAQGYKFVREADVVDACRDKLSVRHIAVFPTVKSLHMEPITAKSGLAGMFVMVEMSYLLVDGESGESMTIEGAGSGTDYPGDKAVYKAQTGAKKYALFQAFQIATGDDPEDEQSEPRKSTGSAKASQKPAAKSEPKAEHIFICTVRSEEGWPCVRPTYHTKESKAHFFKKPDDSAGYDAEGVPASETPQLTPRALGAGSSDSAPVMSDTLPLDV